MRNNIILWNDDNHSDRVWINGKYVGDMSNIANIFTKIIETCYKTEPSNWQFSHIYMVDDFDDIDEEKADCLFDWFYDTEEMTEKENLLVLENNWKELYENINSKK